MSNNINKINDSLEKKISNDEESKYSDACSNSLEIELLIENKNKDIKENKNITKNDYKDNIINDKKIKNDNKKNYSEINNISSNYNTSSIVSDNSNNNRRESVYSFNSTKSSLLTKINKNHFKKISIDIPKKGHLNNRYILNSKQFLTPIEEKDKGTYNCTASILSYDNKKLNIEEQGTIQMRKSLEQKIFISFSL